MLVNFSTSEYIFGPAAQSAARTLYVIWQSCIYHAILPKSGGFLCCCTPLLAGGLPAMAKALLTSLRWTHPPTPAPLGPPW